MIITLTVMRIARIMIMMVTMTVNIMLMLLLKMLSKIGFTTQLKDKIKFNFSFGKHACQKKSKHESSNQK